MLSFSLFSFQSLAVVGSKRKWSSRRFVHQRTCRWRNFPKLCPCSSQLSCSHGGADSDDRFLFGGYASVVGHVKRKTTWGNFLDSRYEDILVNGFDQLQATEKFHPVCTFQRDPVFSAFPQCRTTLSICIHYLHCSFVRRVFKESRVTTWQKELRDW